MSHPSRLALDRLALGTGDEETKAHVAACTECATHLQKVQVELPIPAWVNSAPIRGRFLLWPAVVLGAASVFIGIAGSDAFWQNDTITPKGAAPEAVVWLKHQESVTPWNGQTVHPGDSIRLEYAAAGFTQLTILDGDAVADRETMQAHGFSQSLVFDAEPGPEHLTVVLANTPLSDDEIRAALDGGTTTWTKSWTFPKETK